MLYMCSELLREECPPLRSIHATAADCQQRELGAVHAESAPAVTEGRAPDPTPIFCSLFFKEPIL